MPDPPPETNIAIIRLSSFGDIVITEPVTRALREHYPGGRLFFVTGAPFAALPAMFEAVDCVIAYEKQGPNEALRELGREVAVDVVVDLQNNLRSRRVSAVLGGRRVVRYSRPVVRRFMLVKMPWLWRGELRHTIDLYGDALGLLGIGLRDRVPRIEVGAEALVKAGELLGAGVGKTVAVCPGGSSPHKRWPEPHFARLVEAMAEEGLKPLIVGAQEDKTVAEAVAALAGTPPGVLVSRDVEEIAAILSLAPVTVSNDSGLMHLAAAAGSRVVALFGPTSPALGFGPLGEGHKALGLSLRCRPCSYHGNRPCRLERRVCMEDLTPARVRDEVLGALGEAGNG